MKIEKYFKKDPERYYDLLPLIEIGWHADERFFYFGIEWLRWVFSVEITK